MVAIFFVTLLVVAVITIKISDTVLDSRIGALDRTLGFLFGLGRGLVIMVVAFVFVAWLVPEKAQPKWITEAKSHAYLEKDRRMDSYDGAGERRPGEVLPDGASGPTSRTRRRPRRSGLGPPPGRLAFADAKSH